MDRKCGSEMRISQSRHSRRIEPMTLSQIALAFGQRGGHDDHKITGNDSLGVQTQECRPP
jgi:hypothetical protein